MAGSAEEVQKHLKFYLTIGIALLVLTFVTVFVARPADIVPGGLGKWIAGLLDFGVPGVSAADIVLGLLIATLKASLVAVIFMHLKEEKGLIYKTLVFTAVFVTGMLSLMLLAKFSPLTWDGFFDPEKAQIEASAP